MKNHIIKIKALSCVQLQLKNFNTAVKNSIMQEEMSHCKETIKVTFCQEFQKYS